MFLPMYSTASAGTIGKITGQVTDREGNPLPGASVVIEGTRRGTEADEEGFYVLLSVEPGVHTLAASVVGFRSERKEGVVVSSDFTTNASFELREEALALGEVVVAARRGGGGWGMLSVRGDAPPVEPDRMTTIYRITAADIEAVPMVRATETFIGLQPGVTVDETGEKLTIRAGEPEDVAYYIDGVPMPTSDHVETRVYRDFNRTAIQELTIVTGGMNAEYGNAQGGIVSVVTREGGQDYGGLLDYRFSPRGRKHWGENVYDSGIHQGNNKWDDPDWVGEMVTLPDGREAQAHRRLDYTGVSGHFVEGNVSGPLAKGVTFFTSARWRREASIFPGPYLSTPFNLNTSLKLSCAASENLKVQAGGWYDRRMGAFDPGGMMLGMPTGASASLLTAGGRLGLRDGGRNLFMADADPAGGFFDTDYMVYAGVTHLLSKKTFYDLRLSCSTSRRDTTGVKLPSGLTHTSEAVSGDPVTDRAGHYTVYRDVVAWERFRRSRLSLKADLSSQVNRQHFLKTGLEVIRYDNWYQTYLSDGPELRFVGWYGRTYEDTDFFPDKRNKGVNPVHLAAYAQDKVEIEGMVINLGVRWEALFQNTWVTDVDAFYGATSPMWHRMTRNRNVPTIVGPTIQAFGPRLGISHPMTERAVVRYFYGRFLQFPSFRNLFFNSWSSAQAADSDLNGNGEIDPAERWNAFGSIGGNDLRMRTEHHNPYLPPEETTSFEAGLDWNFVSDYVLNLTTYYKSAGNQIVRASQQWTDPMAPAYVTGVDAFVEGRYRDIRGFEMSLKKRFSHMVAFNLALNMQWAHEGDNTAPRRDVFPDSLFVANGHYWVTYDVDPATGAEIPVPLQEMALREGKDPDFYIRMYGGLANQVIRNEAAKSEMLDRSYPGFIATRSSHYAAEGVAFHSDVRDKSFYSDQDRAFWERVNRDPDYPGTGEGNLLAGRYPYSGRRMPVQSDRRAFGSLTLLLATPAGFGPFRGKALGNCRANLVYRFYTGTPFEYRTVGSEYFSRYVVYRHGPMHTRMDLNVEKQFGHASGGNLTVGLEVFNLFNQKDVRSVPLQSGQGIDFDPKRWQQWGIQGPEPVTAKLTEAEEIFDISNYWDRPREIRFSVRIRW